MRHIAGKNLNLLTVFVALWRERNVTKAAQVVGMTQPALSRALARLRVEFSDPLFVRVARGVAPTDRAEKIAKTIVDALKSIDKVYSLDPKFNPLTLNRVITIAASDYFEVIAASRLIPMLAQKAPGITINFRTDRGVIPREAMERGDIDLVVSGIFEQLPEGFYHQKLLTDNYRTAVRKDHPVKTMTFDKFVKLSHILVTPKGDLHGIVDEALTKIRKLRRIAIGSPHFLSAGWMIANTDYVLSAPSLIIESLKEFIPLRDFAPPVSIAPLELFQIWHARSHHDPAHKWLRQHISNCCKT